MKAAVAATLAVLSLPAAAEPQYLQVPDWPVPLRAVPGGPIVETLAPGATVETTGEDGAWVRVPLAERDAWVARDALRPVAVDTLAGSALPAGLLCSGTEPFWSLRLGPEAAVFDEPGAEADTFGLFAAAPAAGQRRFPALLTLMQDSRSMLAVIRPAACNDGMSDRTQPWQVDLVRQQPDGAGGILTLRTGCCRLPPQP